MAGRTGVSDVPERPSPPAKDNHDGIEYEPDYCELEDELEDSFASGDYCGRWVNGRLGKFCSLAGTEECDWECPYSR